MLGKRFLAVLAVVALGTGSAVVGLTMAAGEWSVVGTGLEPGQGYGLLVADGQDRLKLELLNVTSDPVASFSVWTPEGERAGFYQLDASNKAAEIGTIAGPWLIFVYKAHGGDLTLSVHGSQDVAAQMLPAPVERREFTLGQVNSESLSETFTTVLPKEPALAGVYLRGSARELQSELRTDKGIVEVVHDEAVSAVEGGMIVSQKGERTTLPQNLVKGPYTAQVQAEEIRGTLQLVALFLGVPEFDLFDEEHEDESGEAPEAESAPTPPKHPHSKRHKEAHTAVTAIEAAECGEADSRIPYALEVPGPSTLRLTLIEPTDPPVSVYDPADQLLGVIVLEEEGEQGEMHVGPGEHVLYARGARILVELIGVEECELRELKVEQIAVGAISGDTLLGSGETVPVNFTLEAPPLEFGIMPDGADTVVMNGYAVFTAPDGEVGAESSMSFGMGLTGDSGLGGLAGIFGDDREHHGWQSSYTDADPEKMVNGDWLLEFNAEMMHGNVVAYALHYVRGEVSDEE